MDNVTEMSSSPDRVDQRLDRIEGKIDKLSDAVIAIARAEERIVAIDADKQEYWERLNSHSKKIDEHDVAITKASAALEMIERMHARDREETNARAKDQGQRVGALEKTMADVSRTTIIIHRLTWSVAAVITAYIVNSILGVL